MAQVRSNVHLRSQRVRSVHIENSTLENCVIFFILCLFLFVVLIYLATTTTKLRNIKTKAFYLAITDQSNKTLFIRKHSS